VNLVGFSGKIALIHQWMEWDILFSKGQNNTGWWFGTFYDFPYIGNNHPN